MNNWILFNCSKTYCCLLFGRGREKLIKFESAGNLIVLHSLFPVDVRSPMVGTPHCTDYRLCVWLVGKARTGLCTEKPRPD